MNLSLRHDIPHPPCSFLRAWAWYAGILMFAGACSCSQVLTADGLQGGTIDAGLHFDVDANGETAPDAPDNECNSFLVDCDGDASNGCETDLRTDPNHCGACGNSCLGGACLEGRCQPFALATEQDVPSVLTLDATHLYWTNQGGTGAVMRIEKQGGTPELVGVTDFPPGGMEVDKDAVYWSENADSGTVWRLAKDDIGLEIPPTALVDGQGKSIALTLDTNNVYWVTPATLKTVPKTGGNQRVLARDQGIPFWVLVDGNFLYWTNTMSGQVMRNTLLDADAGAVEIASGQHMPLGIVSDPAYLYWANHEGDSDGGTPSIMRLGKTTMTPEVLVDGQMGPTAIRAFGSDLYWTNNLGGSIMRMSKIGGDPVPIAEGQASPAGLAVDSKAVYWVNRDDGRVMGIAR